MHFNLSSCFVIISIENGKYLVSFGAEPFVIPPTTQTVKIKTYCMTIFVMYGHETCLETGGCVNIQLILWT
jgi:hypothetical protein